MNLKNCRKPVSRTAFTFAFTASVLSLWTAACQSAPQSAPAALAVAPDTTAVPLPVAGLDTVADLNYLFGKFDPATDARFVRVEKPHTDRAGMYLRREAYEAFQRMYDAAKKDGITLRIISSTRTFAQQTAIWNGKWTRFAKEAPAAADRARKILEYSAMPGASRHHWGTDIDLNDLNNPAFEGRGAHARVYAWLVEHAHEYGYCQPYTAGRPYGYHEERWHWSYSPLSKPLLSRYRQQVTDDMLDGFQGSGTAKTIGVVKHYALGINPECQ